MVTMVVCHPRPESFTHAAAGRVRAALLADRHEVRLHDLYVERFDPVLRADEYLRKFSLDDRVQEYYRDLTESDGIVVLHPDWWGMPPALLVGWIDRVFRPGIAYEFEGYEFGPKRKVPLLSGKRALVFCTTDADRSGSGGARHPLVRLWRDTVFGYCGVEARVKLFYRFRDSTPAERERWLTSAARTAHGLFAVPSADTPEL